MINVGSEKTKRLIYTTLSSKCYVRPQTAAKTPSNTLSTHALINAAEKKLQSPLAFNQSAPLSEVEMSVGTCDEGGWIHSQRRPFGAWWLLAFGGAGIPGPDSYVATCGKRRRKSVPKRAIPAGT